MGKILELRKKLGLLQTEIDAYELKADEEKRSLNKDEYTEINKRLDQMDSIELEIKNLERIEQKRSQSAGNASANNQDGDDDDDETRSNKNPSGFNANTYKVGNPEEKFRSLGEMLQAVARASMPLGSYIAGQPTGKRDRRLDNIGYEARAAAGANQSVPSDGGFLIGKDESKSMYQKLFETGKLLSRTNDIPIGPNANGYSQTTIEEDSRATGSRNGGIRVYRANEAGSVDPSKLKLGKLKLDLEKMMGLAYITEEQLQDDVQLESYTRKGFNKEFNFKIDDEIINGTGAGQMLGLLVSKATISVAKETGQASKTVVAENIDNMYARIASSSKLNGVWLINAEVQPQLRKMSYNVGTGGALIYVPPGGMSAAPYGTLYGRPVIEMEQCSALGTVGDIIYADLSEYLTIAKGGIKEAVSIHVKFLTEESAFRFTLRINGMPMWSSPLTPYKGNSGVTYSPFVTLAAR